MNEPFQGLCLSVLDPSGLKKPRLMFQAVHGQPIVHRQGESWKKFIPVVVFCGAVFFLFPRIASTGTPPPGLQQAAGVTAWVACIIGVLSVMACILASNLDDGHLVADRHVVDYQALDKQDIEWTTAHTVQQLMDHIEALSLSELHQADALSYDINRLLLLSYRARETGRDHLARQYRQQADKNLKELRTVFDAGRKESQAAHQSVLDLRLQELTATDTASQPAEPDGLDLAGSEPTPPQGTFEVYQPDQPKDTTWR